MDYSAQGLYNKYGNRGRKTDKVYFPYAWTGLNKKEFTDQKIIEKKIPGLTQNRPDISTKIESYQYFADPDNAWLPKFMELNNENKHQRLTPQQRKETKQLNIKSGGVSISMRPGASISMGPGTAIQIGNAIIPGGQQFDVDNPPIVLGNAKKEIIMWVSFHFTTINEPVIPLLQKSLVGIEKIVIELATL